jgi:Sec1 family
MLLRARDPNAGKLIVFVVGGMTRAEIYGLQNVEKSVENIQMVIGTTKVFTGQEMMCKLGGE